MMQWMQEPVFIETWKLGLIGFLIGGVVGSMCFRMGVRSAYRSLNVVTVGDLRKARDVRDGILKGK